jgi:hypothetical protein
MIVMILHDALFAPMILVGIIMVDAMPLVATGNSNNSVTEQTMEKVIVKDSGKMFHVTVVLVVTPIIGLDGQTLAQLKLSVANNVKIIKCEKMRVVQVKINGAGPIVVVTTPNVVLAPTENGRLAVT